MPPLVSLITFVTVCRIIWIIYKKRTSRVIPRYREPPAWAIREVRKQMVDNFEIAIASLMLAYLFYPYEAVLFVLVLVLCCTAVVRLCIDTWFLWLYREKG
jgi:hypothetical protein